MGGFCAMNGTRRDVVELLSAETGRRSRGARPSVEQAGPHPVAEDLGQFGVKLGERGAEGALARWVGAAAEVAGYGEGGVANEISDAQANSHFALRLLSRSSGSAAVALRAARETE
jgi:hypothetical protein